jgi:hypothetical protein
LDLIFLFLSSFPAIMARSAQVWPPEMIVSTTAIVYTLIRSASKPKLEEHEPAMKAVNSSTSEEIDPPRHGDLVASHAGAFGTALRKTRLTALPDYRRRRCFCSLRAHPPLVGHQIVAADKLVAGAVVEHPVPAGVSPRRRADVNALHRQ